MHDQPTGVLLMAYGTPKTLEELPAYYTHIRGGQPPAPQQIEELARRYRAIGGRSPLHEITLRQAEGLERALRGASGPVRVYLGMKHAEPFIEDAIADMRQDGVGEAIALVLAPHYSKLSVGSYFERVRSGVGDGAPRLRFIESWHEEPEFIGLMARRVRDALARFPQPERDEVRVVFTAHSLPTRILRDGDPYLDQVHRSGDLIAREAGLRHWLFAWQSAGRTDDEWLAPDLRAVIKELRQEGRAGILICPVGFVSDHLEVLYDIDIAAQSLARDLDVALQRTASPNADEDFVQALGAIVRRRLET